jgi:putative spermidine/putrescine transport system substrate-binding protein
MTFSRMIACAVSLAVLAGTGAGAQARDLTVVGFGGTVQDAYRKAYWDPYAALKGIKYVEDTTNGGLAKQKAMIETGNVTWDVMQMEADEVAIACDEGLLADVDWTTLSSYKDSEPSMFTPCGVGAIVWSEVLTYDADKIKEGPQSWADFWNVEKWPGKRGLRKTAKLTLELALMADGVAPADVYTVLATPEGQDRAFAKLDEIKPHIQWWESGAQPLEWLAAGSVAMTAAFNGRITTAQGEGRNFPVVWNEQLFAIDYWAIMANSPNHDQAVDLVDYMNSTGPQKLFAETIPYGIANKEAMAQLDPAVLAILPSAPENQKRALSLDTRFWIDHGQELSERFSNWVAR